MFSPRFSLEFDLTFDLEEIDRSNYRIERMLIMPKHEQWLRREAFIRTAFSSTMVEDATITEEEMERAAKPSPAASIPKERPDVVNYARALEFVDFLSDMRGVSTPIPLEATIRQIHWSLMNGIEDHRLRPGQYRTEPNWIIDRGTRVYEPPYHVDVPILMRGLSEWLQKENEEISPILRAGLAHLHLVAIHPFVDGNGRTARLLATLILQQSGYGFRRLLSLDAYYQRNRDEYIDALRKSLGERYEEGYDSTVWLKFFSGSVLLQTRSLERKLTDWRMTVDQIHRNLGSTGLNERQIDCLIYATRMGHITRKDYAEITDVSTVTASRDISNLVERGILIPEGRGRNRRYRYGSAAEKNKE